MKQVLVKMKQTVEDTHRVLGEDDNGPTIDHVTLGLKGGQEYALNVDRAKKLVEKYDYAEYVADEAEGE